jgi:hydrogenase nickel incorporation protein HypA/HybF
MHEMSIAMTIVESVVEKAGMEGAGRVSQIELVVGRLAGVAIESLKFCFSAASRETLAESAELVIAEKPAIGECEDCGMRFSVDFHYARCQTCGGFRVKIVSGEELYIQSITIE